MRHWPIFAESCRFCRISEVPTISAMSTATANAVATREPSPGCRRDRPGRPRPHDQPLQPAVARAALSLAEGCLQRQLHRAGLPDDGVLRRLLRRADRLGVPGGSLRPAPHPVRGPCVAGCRRIRFCVQPKLLGHGAVFGGGRRRQRRLSPGGLHVDQSQGQLAKAGPCIQLSRHHRQPGLGAGARGDRASGNRFHVAGRLDGCGRIGFRGAGRCCGSTGSTWHCRRWRAKWRDPRPARRKSEGSFDFLRIPAVWTIVIMPT